MRDTCRSVPVKHTDKQTNNVTHKKPKGGGGYTHSTLSTLAFRSIRRMMPAITFPGPSS